MKILMVCLGNICRSPMAEYILREKAIQNHKNWTIASAGTQSYHVGETAYHKTLKISQEKGLDISAHRAQQFQEKHFLEYDKIYVFAADVMQMLKQKYGATQDFKKVDFFTNELYPGQNQDVTDPWYYDEDMYRKVFDQISEICDCIIHKYP